MKKFLSIIITVLLISGLTACNKTNTDSIDNKEDESLKHTNVYVLSGPTGIGAANLKSDSEIGKTKGDYTINIVSTPDEIAAKISSGEADIAAVATNLAAKLYNKTNGGVKILAVNTLGVLNVVAPDGVEITDFKDLSGKKVFSFGVGSNPEYIINYLAEKNNFKDTLKIEYKADANELLTVWATEPDALIIAPQPVATVLTVNYPTSKLALDLTTEWEKVSSDSSLMMGCIIARSEFADSNADTVDLFLEEYRKSVKTANEKIDNTAKLCESYGIIPKAIIAQIAIPYCNLTYIDSKEMRTELTGYFEVLYSADKASVGGKLPDEKFYYKN